MALRPPPPESGPGTLIRDVRLQRGLSQEQLARRAGTTQAVVSRLERGERSPTVATLDRLLLVMGVQLQLSTTTAAEALHDPAELRHGRSLSPTERLERAFAWNAFAAEISGAARGDTQ